jgi:hypothetical protein
MAEVVKFHSSYSILKFTIVFTERDTNLSPGPQPHNLYLENNFNIILPLTPRGPRLSLTLTFSG